MRQGWSGWNGSNRRARDQTGCANLPPPRHRPSLRIIASRRKSPRLLSNLSYFDNFVSSKFRKFLSLRERARLPPVRSPCPTNFPGRVRLKKTNQVGPLRAKPSREITGDGGDGRNTDLDSRCGWRQASRSFKVAAPGKQPPRSPESRPPP